MDQIQDYLENLEANKTSSLNSYNVLICLCKFARLLWDIMPDVGKHSIKISELFIEGNATKNELKNAKIRAWESHDQFNDGSQERSVLRAVLCALYYPLKDHELLDSLFDSMDYCLISKKELTETQFLNIAKSVFEKKQSPPVS